MTITECRVCFNNDCTCRNSLKEFISTLSKVDQRVSSCIVTSVEPILGIGSIDKIILKLNTPILLNEVQFRLKEQGIFFSETKLKDKRNYLVIGKKENGTFVNRPYNTLEPMVTTVITRPSAFKCYENYLSELESFLTPKELKQAKISRIDLAIDYPVKLTEILKGFDCKRKQLHFEYISKSSFTTGIRIGNGQEKFIVYDHGTKHKTGEISTRIECQLKGRKCLIKSIYDLPNIAKKLNESNPFDKISLYEVGYRSEETFPLSADQKRLNELKIIIENNGLLMAKKKLNLNRNFSRDYEKFLDLKLQLQQPKDSLNKTINQFFLGGKK